MNRDSSDFQLLQGVEIDVPQGVDLVPQFFDLLLHFFPLPLLLAAGLVLELGQLDAIVFAEPGGKGFALQADLVGGKVAGVQLLLDLAAAQAGPLDLGVQLIALLLEGFALLHEADDLGSKGFLAKIQVGKLRLGPQDVPARGLRPLNAKLQLLAAFVDRAAAFLAGFVELPQPQAQAPQALLALGQLDLGFRRFAIAGLPLAFQAGHLLLKAGQAGFHLGEAGLVSPAFLAGFGQPCHGRIVLHRRGPEFAVQRRPLLTELGPPLLGSRQFMRWSAKASAAWRWAAV